MGFNSGFKGLNTIVEYLERNTEKCWN